MVAGAAGYCTGRFKTREKGHSLLALQVGRVILREAAENLVNKQVAGLVAPVPLVWWLKLKLASSSLAGKGRIGQCIGMDAKIGSYLRKRGRSILSGALCSDALSWLVELLFTKLCKSLERVDLIGDTSIS